MKSLSRALRHFFLPHEANNHKAKILHPSGLLIVKFGLVFLQILLQFAILAPKNFPNVLGYAANISVEEVIKLTNAKRAENGLAPLKENKVLDTEALAKGNYMLEKDFWAHVAPDGTEPWYFFRKGGYKYRYAGENLARDFSTATTAVDAWMASPSHRENMLNSHYKDIGVAVVEGDLAGVDTTIIVQFFGTRLADSLPPEPVAEATLATPSPTPVPVVAGTTPRVLISPFVTTKTVSVAVLGLLLLVLAIDAFVTSKRKVRRIGGRVFAHIAFLGMILIILLLLKAGSVI